MAKPRTKIVDVTDDPIPMIVERICKEIMEGKSLRQICAADDMVHMSTVHRWLAANPEFASKCARAREIQADTIFEEMQEIADTGNPDDVQRAKLRVSTMQWRAAKLAPKKYGDKLAIGGDESMGPLTVVINKPA